PPRRRRRPAHRRADRPVPARPRGGDRPGAGGAHRAPRRLVRTPRRPRGRPGPRRAAPRAPVRRAPRPDPRRRRAERGLPRASRALAAARPAPAGRVLVAGNLPYSVGKPILMALVEAGPAIDEMALMLQREVAERLAAAPGTRVYGSLSVLTQMACDVALAFG